MVPKCARRHPGQGEPPLNESDVGTTDGGIVAESACQLNGPLPDVHARFTRLPAELLDLAEQIADCFVASVKSGGRQ